MRTPTPILLVAVLFGCEPDLINMGRRDTGVIPDSGIAGALPLLPGMTFTYRGTLTYRDESNREQTSLFDLTVVIASVDDQGVEGESSLEFTATGMNLLDDDFAPSSEFDLWVARLGPTQAEDVMAPVAVHETLFDPPAIAPAPTPPKQLPRGGAFFIDVRQTDQITGAFSQAHQGQQPQVTPPDMSMAERWVFSFTGEDPSIFYYSNKKRSVRLEYDRNGWLARLDETISDGEHRPWVDAKLILMAGP
jgi:hypothetical protein